MKYANLRRARFSIDTSLNSSIQISECEIEKSLFLCTFQVHGVTTCRSTYLERKGKGSQLI